MGAVTDDNAGTVALLEATAEARALIEDVTRLAEELKGRQDRLGELLAPSEAALRARTEYLDQVTREQLGAASQRVSKVAEDVERIARSLNDQVARLAEADARRWSETRRRERWRTVASLLLMLLGGFLAGQVASSRSGATANAKPAAVEEKPTKSAPSAPRRSVGQGAKPAAAPAR
jgi:hypothetical protein